MNLRENRNITTSKQLATWPKVHPCFWSQMRIGILSHLLPTFKSPKKGNVQSFFKEHYGNKADPLVFDGNSNGYLSQLTPLIHSMNSLVNILDLGCGNGTLYHFLTKQGFDIPEYTGLDFAISSKSLSTKAYLRKADFTSPETTEFFDSKNSIFAINTFCYIENLLTIPILSEANKKREDTLFILEPWPGWFWDRHFDGIWPKYRSPNNLITSLSKIGWTPIHQVSYYLTKTLGQHFLPLSYALSFKKII